ncbi:VOC family protein [Chachezhania sediminis]|uniref:VOC family protein n=1 Tax=Chachezhania sediminis TaxID=2599291 RepID=UPI00131A6D4C|nr:VOC family protein [Chachezhania sediminis]
MQTPTLSALDHLVLTVADIDRTLAFYCDGLGMEAERFTVTDGTERLALKYGSQKINLHPAESPFEPKALVALPGTADLCFLSDTSVDIWIAHLEAIGLSVLDGPVPRTGATGPLTSIYLRDPDGNLVEISNAG